MATILEERIRNLVFSDKWGFDAEGQEAAAAKLAALPRSAKNPRGSRAGKKTSKAGHVQTTDKQRDALERKVVQECAVAGAVAVAMLKKN